MVKSELHKSENFSVENKKKIALENRFMLFIFMRSNSFW